MSPQKFSSISPKNVSSIGSRSRRQSPTLRQVDHWDKPQDFLQKQTLCASWGTIEAISFAFPTTTITITGPRSERVDWQFYANSPLLPPRPVLYIVKCLRLRHFVVLCAFDVLVVSPTNLLTSISSLYHKISGGSGPEAVTVNCALLPEVDRGHHRRTSKYKATPEMGLYLYFESFFVT